MQRRSFIGWLGAWIVSAVTPKLIQAAPPKVKAAVWHKGYNVYGDIKAPAFPHEYKGFWPACHTWQWNYGWTNLVMCNPLGQIPKEESQNRWLIYIQGQPRETPLYYFQGTEEQAMAEAENSLV